MSMQGNETKLISWLIDEINKNKITFSEDTEDQVTTELKLDSLFDDMFNRYNYLTFQIENMLIRLDDKELSIEILSQSDLFNQVSNTYSKKLKHYFIKNEDNHTKLHTFLVNKLIEQYTTNETNKLEDFFK